MIAWCRVCQPLSTDSNKKPCCATCQKFGLHCQCDYLSFCNTVTKILSILCRFHLLCKARVKAYAVPTLDEVLHTIYYQAMSVAFLRLEGLILIPSVLLLFVDPLLVELLTAAGVRINFDFRASQKGLKSTVIPPPVAESSATSRGSTAAEVQQQAWKQTHFWTL